MLVAKKRKQQNEKETENKDNIPPSSPIDVANGPRNVTFNGQKPVTSNEGPGFNAAMPPTMERVSFKRW